MAIQTTYNLTLDKFLCGQMANTIPGKCESGVLGGDATTSLPFGRACQWTGPNAVGVGAARKEVGTLAAQANANATSITVNFHPGVARLAAGDTIVVATSTGFTNPSRVEAVSGTNGYTISSLSAQGANGAKVYVYGGPTSFAGVAVRDVTIPAANGADNFAFRDIVPVGTEGDFVVEVDGTIVASDYGVPAGVNISTANDSEDYGKFTKSADGSTVIGIPNAIFVSASEMVGGKTCAILRLPKQST